MTDDATPRLAIEPIDTSFSFKNKAYEALKNVIVSMDIYRSRTDIRLDERQLAQVFRRLGEEPNARRIAREVVRRRNKAPFATTGDLVASFNPVLNGQVYAVAASATGMRNSQRPAVGGSSRNRCRGITNQASSI